MTKLEQLRKKIIEVTDVEARNSSVMIKENGFSGLINHRDTTIRLADVLYTLEQYFEDDENGNARLTALKSKLPLRTKQGNDRLPSFNTL